MPEPTIWYRWLLCCTGNPSLCKRSYWWGHECLVRRRSLVSKHKEVSTTNAARKAKVFCNSVRVYSRSCKIQRVLQLFALFGKENEQMHVTDVIGLRGKANKGCLFKMNFLWTQRGKMQGREKIKKNNSENSNNFTKSHSSVENAFQVTLRQCSSNIKTTTSTAQEENMFFLYNFPLCADLWTQAGQLLFLQNVQKIWNVILQHYAKIGLQLVCTISKWASSHIWYLSTLAHNSRRKTSCFLR